MTQQELFGDVPKDRWATIETSKNQYGEVIWALTRPADWPPAEIQPDPFNDNK
jgi:hypothetical protein